MRLPAPAVSALAALLAALPGPVPAAPTPCTAVADAPPQGEAREFLRLPRLRYFPEGIAHDPDTGTFYVGSVRERAVGVIDHGLRFRGLVPPAAGGLWAAMGMQVEAARRQLWVASVAVPEMEGYEPALEGRSGLFVFDLASGAPRRRYDLPADGRKHWLGDLLLTRQGRVFASDSGTGELYELDRSSGRFDALTAPGALRSPQGLAAAADGRRLFLADYAQGLYAYDLAGRSLSPLAAPDDACLHGIDGLYAYRGDLLAIQNGVRPQRVLRLRLDPAQRRVERVEVLAAALPQFGEPTLGVVVKNRFYFIANSPWGKLGADRRLPADDRLDAPLVMRIELAP